MDTPQTSEHEMLQLLVIFYGSPRACPWHQFFSPVRRPVLHRTGTGNPERSESKDPHVSGKICNYCGYRHCESRSNPYKITSPYGLVMTPMDISSKCTQLSTATIFLPDSCDNNLYWFYKILERLEEFPYAENFSVRSEGRRIFK